MTIGILSLHLIIPGCSSLKQKRSCIKPMLYRIHRAYNVSIAETGMQDNRCEVLISAVFVSNEAGFISNYLQRIISFIEGHFSGFEIIDQRIEII